ncbi:MAG: efflux RND transporter permease subunit, partial [Selenomonadaceae bacterium]|nr:efflux RND transporter permease subunit [Selenomonadaceae bacterium]
QIVEQKVNGTQGMDYMSSTSGDDGSYRLSVVFNVGTDGDMDSVKVQNNVASATPQLPSDVQSTGITTVKSSSDMAMIFALYCDNGRYNRTFIKNYADIYLLDTIQRIEGVGNVQVFGADYAMRIWVNPEKLAAYGLTVNDISSAVKRQNSQAAAGTIGAMPVNQGQEKQYTGKIQGRLSTPEEFANIIIKSDSNGSLVRLKDVARVEIGAKDSSTISKFNGSPSIGFAVNLTSDANAMETIGEIKNFLNEAREDFPEGIKYGQVLDSTEFIEASLEEVIETFVEALLLVVFVIFIFLQSWRATVIPLLAVPVSLIGTLGAFVALDFSINTLTLFAMVLAIGLVVDDAIVVIENVEAHMESEHLSPVEATEKAMAEVQGPVVAIAFVLSAVFIPVAFLGGMMGVLYRQFALTIAISMALSAFIALTLTPALCAMILKPHDPDAKKNILDKFFDAFNNGFERTKNVYIKIVASFIKRSKTAIVFMVIICGLTGLLYKIIPSTFVPSEDQGYFMTGISLPEGTSLNHTSETIDALTNAMLTQIPEISSIMSVGGFDIMSGGAKSSGAVMFVGLKPWSERTEKQQSVTSVTRKVMAIGKSAVPEAFVLAINPPALPGLGSVGGLSLQLQDMSDHTDRELYDLTNKIVAAANQRPELTGVSTTFSITSPTYEYEVNREKTEMLGVNLTDVYNALKINYGGMSIDDFNRFGRTYKVMLQSDVFYRSEVESSKFMYVKSSNGSMIPLDTLITSKLNTGTMQISRFNSKRAISISGRAASGYSSGQAMAALEEVIHNEAPEGFNIEWSGQSREEK